VTCLFKKYVWRNFTCLSCNRVISIKPVQPICRGRISLSFSARGGGNYILWVTLSFWRGGSLSLYYYYYYYYYYSFTASRAVKKRAVFLLDVTPCSLVLQTRANAQRNVLPHFQGRDALDFNSLLNYIANFIWLKDENKGQRQRQ
jgi:hypothetical protein